MVRCPIAVDGTKLGLIRRHFLEGRFGPTSGWPNILELSDVVLRLLCRPIMTVQAKRAWMQE